MLCVYKLTAECRGTTVRNNKIR